MEKLSAPLNLFSGIKTALAKIPKGSDLIWWLIEKQNKSWIQNLAPIGFIVGFTGIFSLTYHDVIQAFSISLALLIQMYCHEQGHHAIFKLSKVNSKVLWLLPLGAVAAPVNKQEDARSDRLPWFIIAWLTQAGITVNVILMGIGILLSNLAGPNLIGKFGQDLTMTGGMLGISNLIPVWQLDAKMLFKVIFASLKQIDDRRFSVAITILAIGAITAAIVSSGISSIWPILIGFITHLGWIVVLLIMVAGIWHQQGIDDPTLAESKQAMTRAQAALHVAWYIALLYISMRLTAGPLLINF
jgi:hypothetical protein